MALILDTPNKNNRLYRTEVIEKALPAAKELIKEERLVITSDEPYHIVSINDIVAEVKDIFIDGIRLVIDFEFLTNPLANAVQEELNRGAVSVRSNGYGTLRWDDDKGVYIVDDNYQITCFSFTYNPS